MRRTSPTAICSSVSGCRMLPNNASSIGWRPSVQPFPRSGNICSYAAATLRVSAAACSSDTPGFNRPTARSQCARPCAAAGANPNAIHASDAPSKRSNEGGVTPMIVVLCPSMSAVWPDDVATSTEAPLPERVAQHDRTLGAAQIFLGSVIAAEERRQAERRERRGGDPVARQPLRGEPAGVVREVHRPARRRTRRRRRKIGHGREAGRTSAAAAIHASPDCRAGPW